MWNPSTGADESRKDVSISEGKNNLSGTSDKNVEGTFSEKGEVESQQDSGFLSGPQLSSYIDSEEIIPDKQEDKSSNQAASSKTSQSKNSILDSGCLEGEEDDESAQETDSKPQKSSTDPMILDSGIDSGFTEWFCKLSLKNSSQPLNNLGTSTKQSDIKDKNISTDVKKSEKQPWEIYFVQNEDGDTQLHIACLFGQTNVVNALIRLAPHPCLLNIRNDNGQTALHIAVLTGQRNIARILLIAGAEATVRDRNGNTALHLACMAGDKDCVEALTIPINATEIQECRHLFPKNDKSAYRRCTQLPPDLEQRNDDGEHCVHLAAKNSHIDVLRHLVWFGADINAREGTSGRTPLHIAIERCNELLANFLMEECNKLNLEIETFAGLTAYQLAALTHNQQILVDLERKGAEPLTPPESDTESDSDSDQTYDRFGDPGYFVAYNGGQAINVA